MEAITVRSKKALCKATEAATSSVAAAGEIDCTCGGKEKCKFSAIKETALSSAGHSCSLLVVPLSPLPLQHENSAHKRQTNTKKQQIHTDGECTVAARSHRLTHVEDHMKGKRGRGGGGLPVSLRSQRRRCECAPVVVGVPPPRCSDNPQQRHSARPAPVAHRSRTYHRYRPPQGRTG
jgi:hypothetical protein